MSVPEDICALVFRLGGFHDARVLSVMPGCIGGVVAIEVDDVNANFLDTDEYEGLCPGVLEFGGVIECDSSSIQSGKSIYDAVVKRVGDHYAFDVRFSPGGFIRGVAATATLRRCCDPG